MQPEQLKWNEQGLIPVIVQDYETKRVLTLAYMNQESLAITQEEGYTCFWSRSRNTLWRKGETSGHVQKVVSIMADCDQDALLIEVIKQGPACHQGTDSCFTQIIEQREEEAFSPEKLYELLLQRKEQLPEGSYTTYLFQKGLDKILKKVGEECTEVIIAAKSQEGNAELIYELADLYYHALVLMLQQGVTLDEVRRELASRHVIDQKVKQEKMV
ncbi:MAG: bifunctional phosphoribosyl-AMP cyclohydrolase/phosphoribosyl-ATP diphosphatase HisIE [Lachnospiraceae bacterium]|jgi:phosphoribosyl-ATP pyrophosphohydrolase/phosphoribosyl-AMP cyclohydrolase|nr:bifunctional phosphoribosyl-AMP cyclohydrolase/phosphoribosyl-ATP diphosphatase HisIE [Lachnospiraceae bacterium]